MLKKFVKMLWLIKQRAYVIYEWPLSKAKKNEETSPPTPAASPIPEKLVPNPFSSDKKKSNLTPAAAATTTPAPQKMVANPFHKG